MTQDLKVMTDINQSEQDFGRTPSQYMAVYKKKSTVFVDKIVSGNEDAPRQLRDYYLQKIDIIKTEKLYPKGDDFDTKTDRPSSLTKVEMEITAITTTLGIAIAKIFADISNRTKDSIEKDHEQSRSIELRANTCRKLLLLQVEVELCRLRMLSNYDNLLFNHDEDEADDIGDIMVDRAKKILDEYNNKIKDLSKELKHTKYPTLLTPRFDDADIFEDMSRTFGPSEQLSTKEPGWARSAAQVSQELYCQYKQVERSVYKRKGECFKSFKLYFWDKTTRFGYKMSRLVFAVGVLIPGFLVLYLLDDHFSSTCNSSIQWYQYIAQYIAITLSYITGPNSILVPCGTFSIYIATAESVTGFVLLALLVSYLYQLLSRDK